MTQLSEEGVGKAQGGWKLGLLPQREPGCAHKGDLLEGNKKCTRIQ